MRRLSSVCFRSLLVLLTIVAAAAMSQHAWAQEVTASITGTVTDPSGAAVPGATVTATSQERGLTFTDVSNDSGLYRIAQLPVGTYTLKVEKSGFALASHAPFVLAVNQVARVDVGMKVGQTSETVEVTGAAPIMETETTQVDTVMNAATNDNLPLASRNYVQLTLLAPGAVSTDPSSFNNGNNTGGYGGRPLINGNREQANNFLLDGMDNNQVSDNLLGYTPAPDAIQEFNLITNNAPAEFGNFEGGIVNATIKSGTNSYHGDVWEFFRNDILNANSWANNLHVDPTTGAWAPLPKQKIRWNMYGGTFGGPIIKNKLFFFADYQAQRFDIPSSAGSNTVFTPAERGGDFRHSLHRRWRIFRRCRQLRESAEGNGGSVVQPLRVLRRALCSRFRRSRNASDFPVQPDSDRNDQPGGERAICFVAVSFPSRYGTAEQRGECCHFCPERRSRRSKN